MYIFGVGDCHRLSPGVTVVLITYRGAVLQSLMICVVGLAQRENQNIYIYANMLYMCKTHIRKAMRISGKGTRAE